MSFHEDFARWIDAGCPLFQQVPAAPSAPSLAAPETAAPADLDPVATEDADAEADARAARLFDLRCDLEEAALRETEPDPAEDWQDDDAAAAAAPALPPNPPKPPAEVTPVSASAPVQRRLSPLSETSVAATLGNGWRTRKDAVAALCALGYGKSAAYGALKRFAAHLENGPDKRLRWLA